MAGQDLAVECNVGLGSRDSASLRVESCVQATVSMLSDHLWTTSYLTEQPPRIILMSSPEASDHSHSSEEDWQWLYSDGPTITEDRPRSTPRSLRGNIRQPKRRIVGACAGSESYYRGDCVLLRAEGSSQCWVAIIQDFTVDDEGRKAAEFVWFSNEKEVMNRAKKRTDALPVCGYICS